SDLAFSPGSATPTAAGRRYLRNLRAQLGRVHGVRCDGHTDNRGTEARNQRLGLRRARAVCRLLTRHLHVRVTVVSYGETRPRATNRTAAGRALNRRVVVHLRY